MNILIVDPSEPIRTLLKDYLTAPDCRVTAASSGEVAVELVQKYKFDLIFLDEELPDLSALKIGGLIREKIDPDVSLVLFTRNKDGLPAKQAHNEGFEVIGKPFALREIEETVEREGRKKKN
ncbi:MAG: response regulator [Deltaproteobacteria bacterium]|nr:response regulator [Deltaproteobacteria bacterium]